MRPVDAWERLGWLMASVWLVFLIFPLSAAIAVVGTGWKILAIGLNALSMVPFLVAYSAFAFSSRVSYAVMILWLLGTATVLGIVGGNDEWWHMMVPSASVAVMTGVIRFIDDRQLQTQELQDQYVAANERERIARNPGTLSQGNEGRPRHSGRAACPRPRGRIGGRPRSDCRGRYCVNRPGNSHRRGPRLPATVRLGAARDHHKRGTALPCSFLHRHLGTSPPSSSRRRRWARLLPPRQWTARHDGAHRRTRRPCPCGGCERRGGVGVVVAK